jgi:hypothetical protein
VSPRTRILLSLVIGFAVTVAMACRAVVQASSLWTELPDGAMLQEGHGLRWVITASDAPGMEVRGTAHRHLP